jgi:anti-anti-sigma regulatory factor
MTRQGDDPTGLTVKCTVAGGATRLAVRGSVDAPQCQALRDALEMARMVRRDGPIVVDLGAADYLAAPALDVLRGAADDAVREHRTMVFRNLRAEAVQDSILARTLHR